MTLLQAAPTCAILFRCEATDRAKCGPRTLHLEDKAAINDILLPLGRNDSALGFANLYSLTEKY